VLSICKVALGQEEYYLATTAAGRDHSEGLVEAPGVWLGEAGERLGLKGGAEPLAVRRLFAGVDPTTGEPLLENPGRRRVAAYDCTFSTPKSVSLTQALSPDPEAREQMGLGHEAAVKASLAYLESEAAAIRFRTPDGHRVVRGGSLVGTGFLHRLSRAGDPHLHTHVLMANLVLDGAGGPARPLDATSLFLVIRTAGALYESHLRFELTCRLGVEWQPLNGRCWSDLKGLDRAAIQRFSQRSTQITEGVQAEGWQGPAARRKMAELTRPAKDTSLSYEGAIERCRQRLWEAGVSDTRLANVCHRVSPESQAALSSGRSDGDRRKDEALRHLAARTVDGSFGPRDVIRALCATAREGCSVQDVQRDAVEMLTDHRVVGRGEHRLWLRGGAMGSVPVGRLEASYTTVDVAATEGRIAVRARSMVSERPEAIMVADYGAGGRFGALDALSLAATAWSAEGRNVIAFAPGHWSAAAVESAVGIDSLVLPPVGVAAQAGGRRVPTSVTDMPIAEGSVVVLAEAQCYGPAVLEGLLRSCETARASVALLGPRWAFESRPCLAEVRTIAALLPEMALTSSMSLSSTARQGPVAGHCFGEVAVTMVPSLGAARDEAARQLAAARHEATAGGATGAILVTGDAAIAHALRAVPGIEAGEVVHSRELKGVLEARNASNPGTVLPPQLVVLGGASVLRQGATAGPGTHRSHIVVVPGIVEGSPAGLGRAAEAARPHYLTVPLGVPPAGPAERAAWRGGAASIEGYRDRWQITDDRRAFGRFPAAVGHPSAREAEQAVVERVAADVRGLSRLTRARDRDAPGLGLGR